MTAAGEAAIEEAVRVAIAVVNGAVAWAEVGCNLLLPIGVNSLVDVGLQKKDEMLG
jgi:hypothetical protein